MPFMHKRRPRRRNRRARRKKRSTIPRKLNVLSKKVSRLSKMIDALDGELIYRSIDYANPAVNANLCAYYGGSFNSLNGMKKAIAQLRYYDIDTPGTLKVVDLDDSAFQVSAQLVRSSVSMEIRTNYLVPTAYIMYLCTVKSDTSLTPINIMIDQDADFANVTYTDPHLFPTDFSSVKTLWNLKRIDSGILQPGQQKKWTHHQKGSVSLEVSFAEMHNASYQKQYQSAFMLLRFCGVLAHDSTVLGEVGLSELVLDAVVTKSITVKYPAGADIKFIFVDSDAPTFTAGPIITNRPLAANQISTP